ncbi:hypothetical protein FHT85_004318 [Rhizobium sp. BK312]|nr:hypothetical protein [Rhizobium sp. BK312]
MLGLRVAIVASHVCHFAHPVRLVREVSRHF